MSNSVSSNMKALRPAPIITNRHARPKRLCNVCTTRQLPCAMVPSASDGNHCRHHKSQKCRKANTADHDGVLHRPRFLELPDDGGRQFQNAVISSVFSSSGSSTTSAEKTSELLGRCSGVALLVKAGRLSRSGSGLPDRPLSGKSTTSAGLDAQGAGRCCTGTCLKLCAEAELETVLIAPDCESFMQNAASGDLCLSILAATKVFRLAAPCVLQWHMRTL